VDAKRNKDLYNRLARAIDEGLVASAQSVGRGGLAVALAKTAIGGKIGMRVDLGDIPGSAKRDDAILYSESQGRVVVTIDPQRKEEFERTMRGAAHARIGVVRKDNWFFIDGESSSIAATVEELAASYKSTFEGH
jgi:phosphoribosylformylglycinamidine synthase